MACCEHSCCSCGHTFFDNALGNDCPKCGCVEVTTHFDEDPFEAVRDIRDEVYEGHAGIIADMTTGGRHD